MERSDEVKLKGLKLLDRTEPGLFWPFISGNYAIMVEFNKFCIFQRLETLEVDEVRKAFELTASCINKNMEKYGKK